MARRSRPLVLDSWAAIAYLEDEPAGRIIADLIADAHEAGMPILMSVVNAGEVWYTVARGTSEADAEETINELGQLGVQFVDADWSITHEAAKFKAKNKMSYADCFAAALARQNKAALVTGDPEFKKVEGSLSITWV